MQDVESLNRKDEDFRYKMQHEHSELFKQDLEGICRLLVSH